MSHNSSQKYYSVSGSKLFRPILQWKASALFVHWLFQGMLYMDRTERLFKISIDILISGIILALLMPFVKWQFALVVAVLIAHTLNFILNGQIFVVLKHFGDIQNSAEEAAHYLKELQNRVCIEPSIRFAAAFGSLARGEMKTTSDLDVRLIRHAGHLNGIKGCWFVLKQRTLAFLKRFPLDIYLLDSDIPLNRLRQDEAPIILKGAEEASNASENSRSDDRK